MKERFVLSSVTPDGWQKVGEGKAINGPGVAANFYHVLHFGASPSNSITAGRIWSQETGRPYGRQTLSVSIVARNVPTTFRNLSALVIL